MMTKNRSLLLERREKIMQSESSMKERLQNR